MLNIVTTLCTNNITSCVIILITRMTHIVWIYATVTFVVVLQDSNVLRSISEQSPSPACQPNLKIHGPSGKRERYKYSQVFICIFLFSRMNYFSRSKSSLKCRNPTIRSSRIYSHSKMSKIFALISFSYINVTNISTLERISHNVHEKLLLKWLRIGCIIVQAIII